MKSVNQIACAITLIFWFLSPVLAQDAGQLKKELQIMKRLRSSGGKNIIDKREKEAYETSY